LNEQIIHFATIQGNFAAEWIAAANLQGQGDLTAWKK
jgi:hypothetical protein